MLQVDLLSKKISGKNSFKYSIKPAITGTLNYLTLVVFYYRKTI